MSATTTTAPTRQQEPSAKEGRRAALVKRRPPRGSTTSRMSMRLGEKARARIRQIRMELGLRSFAQAVEIAIDRMSVAENLVGRQLKPPPRGTSQDLPAAQSNAAFECFRIGNYTRKQILVLLDHLGCSTIPQVVEIALERVAAQEGLPDI